MCFEQAILNNLKSRANMAERSPPDGSLKVALHPYQKTALAWMLQCEMQRGGVQGGLLAGKSCGLSRHEYAHGCTTSWPATCRASGLILLMSSRQIHGPVIWLFVHASKLRNDRCVS